jgi:hypothetical protein
LETCRNEEFRDIDRLRIAAIEYKISFAPKKMSASGPSQLRKASFGRKKA